MRIGPLRHFTQLVDHMLRRWQIRIAHAQIDNIFPRRPRRRPHRVYFSDNVGGQTFDAVEFFGH
jgi:hypothetical protein